MLLFFNVYVQENDNYVRKRKQRKHRKEVKQNAKNKWDMKDLIHLHFRIGKRFLDGGVTTRLPRVRLYSYLILYVLQSVARKTLTFRLLPQRALNNRVELLAENPILKCRSRPTAR